jgi:hypothetical protein
VSKRAILAGGSESAGCMRRRWDDTSEAPMRVALWHAHCEDDEVVRMRALIIRRRCIDAATDAQVRRWERACMRMPAARVLVQGSEGAPEEASLCMVPWGAFDPRSASAAACVEKLFL